MSLIGDALKRQMEKQASGKPVPPSAPAATPAAVPATPPATPAAASHLTLRSKAGGAAPKTEGQEEVPAFAHKPAKHRPVMELVLLGIGVVFLLFAGLAAYNWLTSDKQEPKPVPATAPAKPTAAPVATAPAAPSAPAAQTATPSPSTPPAETSTPSPAVEPVQPPAAVASAIEKITKATAPEIPDSAPDVKAAAEPVASAPVAETPAVAPAPAEPVTVMWPTFNIQAAMGSGTAGSVMINGKIMAVGDEYFGIRILEITPRGVRVAYEGEERLVPVRR